MPSTPAIASKTSNTKSPRQVHFSGQGEGSAIPINRVPPEILKAAKAATTAIASSSSAGPSNSNDKGKASIRGPTRPQPVTVEDEEDGNCQPESFPALGGVPGGPGLQWHRSGIPGASLSLEQGFSPYGHQAISAYPVTMPGYSHAAPAPNGPSFQPPVPDTTFGPMYHVHTPRNDPPGMVPMMQVGMQQQVRSLPVHFIPMPNVPGPPQWVSVGYPQSHIVFQPACAPMPMSQVFMPQQPGMAMQPQIMLAGQQGFNPQQFQPVPMASGGGGGIMGPPGPPGAPSMAMPIMPGNQGPMEITGLGKTPMEEAARQTDFAQKNKLFEPQDFKPADDDPSRFYFVRELDGNWTQRNRFTIENTGDCRWMITPEGWFYAIRQPD